MDLDYLDQNSIGGEFSVRDEIPPSKIVFSLASFFPDLHIAALLQVVYDSTFCFAFDL
jgi:hypothetical protein